MVPMVLIETMTEYTRVAEHLFIRKKTGRYYAVIKKNSRIRRLSLKTKVRDIANARLFDFRLSLGAAPSEVARHKDIPTFPQAVSEVVSLAKKRVVAQKMAAKTLIGIEGHLNKAVERLGHLRMSKIRPSQLKEYLDSRELECSGRTAQVDMTHLRRVFDLAKERGWIWANPLSQLKRYRANTKKVHVPTTEAVTKVLAYLRGPKCVTGADGMKAADFIELLCLSGLRCQGARTLRWEHIDFDAGHLTVTEKGNKTREVDLFPGLRAWLEVRRQPEGLLFPKTHRLKKGNPTEYCPKKSLITACDQTKVQRFTFHACRHYFATQCLETGISASTVAGWLGHTDNGILVMRLYGNHLAKQHFATEAVRVRIHFSQPPSAVEPRLRLAQ
ncbi:MAG: site-specific integrase [Verrucomicrobiae bacterium]|nr:site-specific integrase [Verrucomicrobiae bacterium]